MSEVHHVAWAPKRNWVVQSSTQGWAEHTNQGMDKAMVSEPASTADDENREYNTAGAIPIQAIHLQELLMILMAHLSKDASLYVPATWLHMSPSPAKRKAHQCQLDQRIMPGNDNG